MKSGSRKNQVDKFKLILICFIPLLSIGHRTIKRNAIWWSWQNQSAQNPERFQEWCKETKFQECAELCPTGQTDWTYPRASPVHHTCPVPLPGSRATPVHHTCPVPLPGSRDIYQTCPMNNMTVGIWAPPDKFSLHRTCSGRNPNLPIQRVSFRECPKPVWGHRTDLTGLLWQPQRLVFQIPIESASMPLVDFDVLNDNLIKGLISCVKCISMFLMKVHMFSLIHLMKYNYEASGTIWWTYIVNQ
jgi:hypothetical protein